MVTEASPRAFFSGNSFYTTSANRMARDFCPCAVTPEDVIAVIGGTVPPQPEVPAAWQPLPPVAEESTAWKPKKLPWWRRAIAAVCGAGALAIFWLAAKHTDLTALVGGGTLNDEVTRAMTRNGVTLQAESRAVEAKERLMKHKISAAPVVDENGQLVGAINLQNFYQAGIL